MKKERCHSRARFLASLGMTAIGFLMLNGDWRPPTVGALGVCRLARALACARARVAASRQTAFSGHR